MCSCIIIVFDQHLRQECVSDCDVITLGKNIFFDFPVKDIVRSYQTWDSLNTEKELKGHVSQKC